MDIKILAMLEPSSEVLTFPKTAKSICIPAPTDPIVIPCSATIVGEAVWGEISGSIDDQIDLKARLDSKLDKYNESIIELATKPDSTLGYTGDLLTSVTYADTADFTSNSQALSYTLSKLTQVVHTFTFESEDWTFTQDLTYTGDKLTGIDVTINIV